MSAGLHAKACSALWKKIGEYKWDMEMTTEADTADTVAEEAGAAEAVAASAADAAEATEARAK